MNIVLTAILLLFPALAGLTAGPVEDEKQINTLVTSLLKYSEVKMSTIVMNRMNCESDRAFCDKVAARIRKKIEDSGKWTFTRRASAADGFLQCSVSRVGDRWELRGQLTTKAGAAVWEDKVALVESMKPIAKATAAVEPMVIPATPSPETKKKVAKFFKKKAKQFSANKKSKGPKKKQEMEAARESKALDAASVLGEAVSAGTVGEARVAAGTRAVSSKIPAVARLGIAERVSFDSDRVPAGRWQRFLAAFTPVHVGPQGRHLDFGLGYKHYIPGNETFYKGAGEANGISSQVSWADWVNLEFDYWGREGLAINQVSGLTGIGISPTLSLPIQFGKNLVLYAGGGGRFENISVAASHVPDGTIAYGNHSVLMSLGAKIKLWNLGLDANWAYDFWATHNPSSMLRIGMFYRLNP